MEHFSRRQVSECHNFAIAIHQWQVMIYVVLCNLHVHTMELHSKTKPYGSLSAEVTYISGGSFHSNNDSYTSAALKEEGANSSSSPPMSLEDAASCSIRDVLVSKLRSKKIHDK